MSALKYAFKDIRDHKLIMILFLLLNVMMFSMFGAILSHIDDSRSKVKGLEELRKNTDEAYVLVDTTSEEKFSGLVQDSQGTVEKYNDFFKALSESDLTYYTAYGYDVDTTDKGNTIREQIITEKFLDIFNLSAISGRLLNKDDFNTKNDTVPVMVGYELQDHYKLGNTYELFNGGTGEYFKGLVVGILSKNSEYYELNSVNVALPLDYSYIVPQSIQDTSNMGFSDLDMAETRMVVFGPKNEIQKIISTKSPIDITLIGVIDKIDELLRTHRNEIILLIIILIAIALISICVMWIFYYHIFKKQFHAYNIHYIFGATNSSLYMRFWIISFFIVLVSGGFSIAIFHLITYVTEIMIFALIFATITGSIPVLLIRKKMMR